MPYDDVISDASRGAVKGTLEWTSEKILSFVKKFRERKLAFIKEPKTIEIVKEQFKSGESKFYQKYIKDKKLLFLIRIGLTLRKLENDKERKSNLREKVYYKFGSDGLHIAEFVQNRLLNRYVGILIDELISLENLGNEIEKFLKDIDKHVFFVQKDEKSSDVIRKTLIIIHSNSPKIFVLSGINPAVKIIKECEEKLVSALKNYKLEIVKENEAENLFFKKIK